MSLSAVERKEVEEILTTFGLNEKDRRIYLAILPLGQTMLSPLARVSGLPLTTVQSVVKRLVEQGLVRITKRRTRQVYEALDPIILRRLLERQAEEVSGIIPLLQKMRQAPAVAPKIRVYYKERMTDVFHRALRTKGKLVHEIVSARDLQEILGEKFHFTRRRVKAGVRLQSLRVESGEIKKYSAIAHTRELREAKFLPREMTFRCSVMFWDDTVAFFSTADEALAWTVESPAIRQMIQQIFDLLWSVGRKMETAVK